MLEGTLFAVVKVTLTTNVRLSQPKDQAAFDIVIDDTQVTVMGQLRYALTFDHSKECMQARP